ncbi:MAG: terminase large subunit domain-containing protein, partial [Acidimicrobiales bacterium]
MNAALDLLAGMVLEDGRRWGDAATIWQWAFARNMLDPAAPPFRWESRPRGGSKTTDVAAIVLAAMVVGMPAGAACDCYAADRDQARLLMDALAGLVLRTPQLASVVTVDQYKARTTSGVTLEVMAADAASAFGRRPHFVIVDELCNWPSTSNTRSLWAAIYSSMPKVPGARLAVCTTSGDPVHWSRKVRDKALSSPLWTVAEIPGPLPWIDPAQLEEQRRMLPDSAYLRLHLNQWAAAEDRLVNEGDLAACVTLSGPQEPQPGFQYVFGVDVGLKNDRTVGAVCHAEPLEGRTGKRVVLDRLQVWQGSRLHPVALGDVEASLL